MPPLRKSEYDAEQSCFVTYATFIFSECNNCKGCKQFLQPKRENPPDSKNYVRLFIQCSKDYTKKARYVFAHLAVVLRLNIPRPL